jgi:hypothetical protein
VEIGEESERKRVGGREPKTSNWLSVTAGVYGNPKYSTFI